MRAHPAFETLLVETVPILDRPCAVIFVVALYTVSHVVSSFLIVTRPNVIARLDRAIQ
jgi:hypothetical protein